MYCKFSTHDYTIKPINQSIKYATYNIPCVYTLFNSARLALWNYKIKMKLFVELGIDKAKLHFFSIFFQFFILLKRWKLNTSFRKINSNNSNHCNMNYAWNNIMKYKTNKINNETFISKKQKVSEFPSRWHTPTSYHITFMGCSKAKQSLSIKL